MEVGLNFEDFEDYPSDWLEGLRIRLTTLFSTPEGTCPGDREFGIDISVLDLPPDIVENTLMVELMEKLERYEPSVELTDLKLASGMDGNVSVDVTIRPDEDYEPEEAETDEG